MTVPPIHNVQNYNTDTGWGGLFGGSTHETPSYSTGSLSDMILVVSTVIESDEITGVELTTGGDSFTKAVDVLSSSDHSAVWYLLLGDTSVSDTITVTRSGGDSDAIQIEAKTLSDAAQQAPGDTAFQGSTQSISLALTTSVADELLIGVANTHGGSGAQNDIVSPAVADGDINTGDGIAVVFGHRAAGAAGEWSIAWTSDRAQQACACTFAPAAGGPTTRTIAGNLDAALRRQASFTASANAALRAETALSAWAGAALAQAVPHSTNLDFAAQAVAQAQAELDASLRRAFSFGIGLDANLTAEGLSQRAAGLDGAVRRLNLASGALEAALRASAQGTAELDAWLALGLEQAVGLDAAAEMRRQLSDTALQAVLRATPDRTAGLDAVIGLVVAAAESRTHRVPPRGRLTVAGEDRLSVIPSGNRRH